MLAAVAVFWLRAWPLGAVVTGLDMGKEPLEVARLHALETGTKLDYIQSTIEDHAGQNHKLMM